MGLFDLFSNDSANKARDLANAGATAGYGQLSDQYGQGRTALNTGYGNATGAWQNLLNGANGGAGAYGDASGANGAAGYTRAQQNFQTNPGYQFQVDQGLQALNRTHAAAGNLNSGNADADAIKYGTGLANQSYQNYLSGLQPYLNQQTLGTAGYGNTQAGLGTALNNSYDTQGNAANTTQTTIGNNNAGAELNNYKVGANIWNGIGGAANLLSGGTLGGIAKTVGNSLMGGGSPTGYGSGNKGLFNVFNS